MNEDVITLLLNLKRVRFKLHGDEPMTVSLKKSGAGIVTAADIKCPSQVEILNPTQHIAELTAKSASLDMSIQIERGLGYVPREVHQRDKVDIGTIALDAVFTPIRRANYEVENMRVGDRTDFNRLRIMIETDGTITPRAALEKSIEIMVHQLKAIIGFQDQNHSLAAPEIEVMPERDVTAVDTEILKTRIETLELSSRTLQALETASIRTVGGLVRKTKDDILALDGIGPKGVEEIVTLLTTMGLSLTV
jgi:DNA-directed RNA polymerase subunit alpha